MQSMYSNTVTDQAGAEWKVQRIKAKPNVQGSWGKTLSGREFPFFNPVRTTNRFGCLENLAMEEETAQVQSDKEYSNTLKSHRCPQKFSPSSNKAISEDVMRPRKPVYSIQGDLFVKKIRRQEINAAASHAKTFPGATIDQMSYYTQPSIDDNPDGIILVCGTNKLKIRDP